MPSNSAETPDSVLPAAAYAAARVARSASVKYFFSADSGRVSPRKGKRRFGHQLGVLGREAVFLHRHRHRLLARAPHRQLVLFDDQRIEVLADVFYRRAGQKRPHKAGVRVLYRRRLFVVVLVLVRIERVPRVQRKPRLGQRAHGGKMRHVRPALGAHGGQCLGAFGGRGFFREFSDLGNERFRVDAAVFQFVYFFRHRFSSPCVFCSYDFPVRVPVSV